LKKKRILVHLHACMKRDGSDQALCKEYDTAARC
jgi:hypothetical protein